MWKIAGSALIGGFLGCILGLGVAAILAEIAPKYQRILLNSNHTFGWDYHHEIAFYGLAGVVGFFAGAIIGALAVATTIVVGAMKKDGPIVPRQG
jgi:hypothetical protein